jgi:threonine dehydrogenase-like Zn-dependent dehydrogenase
MKALVKKYAEEGLWLEDVPEPEVGGNDVLIKVHKTAICGTDVHIYNWDEWAQKTIPVPMTSGHEFAGEIVEIGRNVTGLQIGDIVSGEGHVVCGRCRNCLAGRLHLCPNTLGVGVNRDGAFAKEFMESLGILEGFDVCLEMSGSPVAFRDVLSKMINGGSIAMLGLMPDDTGIAWTDVVFKGLNIKGIYGREMYETWYKMVMMVQSGLPIERIITHRFHYTDFQEGFDIMRSGQSGKVILDWKD